MNKSVLKPDIKQEKAITFLRGVAVVKAAAGSGKTRVIERRVFALLDSGTHPRNILILSHTNKAADEIRSRVTHIRAQEIVVGTIHSLCHRILRQYPRTPGLPKGFTVATPASLREMAKEIRQAMKGDKYAGIPKSERLLAAISFSRNTGCSFAEAMSKLYPGQRYSGSLLKEFARRYRRRKKDCGLVDFDDLLSFVVNLLKQHGDVRVSLRQLHRHIMVDEFQDINGIQLRIIKLLFGSPAKSGDRSLMVVGDPGQSIYGFRGARFANWDEVLKVHGVRKLNLRTNHRSSPQIVAVGNVLDDRTQTKRAPAKTPKDAPKSKKPRLTAYPSADAELEDICDLIEQHLANGTSLAEQAILCRTSSYFSTIKAALVTRGLEMQQVGGKMAKVHAVVDNVLAAFRVAANRKDIPALRQLLQVIPGIGKKRAKQIAREASKAPTRKDFHRIIRDEIISRHPNAGNLVVALKTVRKANDLGKAVEHVLDAMLMIAPKKKLSAERIKELTRQLEILQAQATGAVDLREFMANLALEQQSERADPSTDRLTLSTIHGAKGLEWDTVYLPRLEEGHIPHARSQSPEDVAEERRMLYVAATRARRHLYMSYVQPEHENSETGNSGPSRFLSLPGLALQVQRNAPPT